MLDVAVDHPDFTKPIQCECKERELEQARQQRTRAALERLRGEMGRLKDCSFESFRPDWSDVSAFNTTLAVTLATCHQYAAHPKGWLYLWGSYGTGKSHLAAAIANTLAERGVETTYASLPRLMRFLRQGIQPGVGELSADGRLEMLCKVPLLILDDIGAGRATDWANEKLFELVNERYQADLPLVFTSNARPEDAIREARVVDRIYGMATVLALSGPSYRRRDPDGSLVSCT
jgi:DNA replication protein DnaC